MKCKVFVNKNLDGAGCLLILQNVYGDKYDFDITETDVFEFGNTYELFKASSKKLTYKCVFVLNLTVPVKFDPGTIIFNKSSNGTGTSTDLIYGALKHKCTISDQIVKTIASFYSQDMNLKDSWKLHAIFCHMESSPIAFCDRFSTQGLKYTKTDENIILQYKKMLETAYQGIEIYTKGDLLIGLTDKIQLHTPIFKLIFKLHKPKIAFLVDIRSKNTVIRKQPDVNFDLSKFCNSLIDGCAYGDMAGGKITEKFIAFSKEFKHV